MGWKFSSLASVLLPARFTRLCSDNHHLLPIKIAKWQEIKPTLILWSVLLIASLMPWLSPNLDHSIPWFYCFYFLLGRIRRSSIYMYKFIVKEVSLFWWERTMALYCHIISCIVSNFIGPYIFCSVIFLMNLGKECDMIFFFNCFLFLISKICKIL